VSGIWSYQDANGVIHESYEAACVYYGVDTPAQCALEDEYWAQVEADEDLDRRFNDAVLPYSLEFETAFDPWGF